jgi:GntR family transcriptional regulator
LTCTRQASWDDDIEARMPSPDEAAFFELPADGLVPVLEVTRVSLDQNGSPIRLTATSFRADRNRLKYEEDEP